MSTGDLTRWNRAGLSRFRYVDGNAATHLEALRIDLNDRFGDRPWSALRSEALRDETAVEQTARLLVQYRADRRDLAWETTRAFARALHILTEHIDAFANEGYLRTATQWQSVRRLALMVGYSPAPASSATTPLVLLAKPEVTRATVNRGFAVKHIPANAPPVIFETLEDIEVAFVLNALRLARWNVNSNALTKENVFAQLSATVWQIPKGAKISIGGLAVLEQTTSGDSIPAKVDAIADGTALALSAVTTPGVPPPAVPPNLTYDNALLHVAPAQVLVPVLNGSDVVRVASGHDLVAGDVAAWKAGSSVLFAKVIEVDPAALRLQPVAGAAPPGPGTTVFRAASISFAQFTANNSEWRLPSKPNMARSADFRVTFAGSDGQLNTGLDESALSITDATVTLPDGRTVTANYISKLGASVLSGARQVWFADPGQDKPAALVVDALPPPTLEFRGKQPALRSGDLAVLQTASRYFANRIASIEKNAGGYRLTFASPIGNDAIVAVHCAFAVTLRPTGHNVDPATLTDNGLELQLDGAEWPAPLHRGRQLVLASASDAFDPFTARIESFDPSARKMRIDLPASGLTDIRRGDLVIHANVADAGHGETKPVRVLGSGNAAATSQRFVIDVDDLSHVRDPSMPGGVRAGLRIEIEHELYSEVASLRDSEPADPHYVARITEAGTLQLEFGDGVHGRRLPSGSNNVLATYRRGSGLAGNLAGGSLTDIVKKHPLLASFLQPIAAAGGDEREPLAQIRQNAPGRLRAMDRAISVADYQQLAQRFQGVWHAAVFEQPNTSRSREGVRVVIVPASGGDLGPLGDELHSYLLANGLPSIDVTVDLFKSIAVEIAVRARVDSSRFDPREVEGRVRLALLAAFDLHLRQPGQPIYRSEVTHIVENTEGVANSDVVLFATTAPLHEPTNIPGQSNTTALATTIAAQGEQWAHAARGHDGGIWAVFPAGDQVIYAQNPSLVTVTTSEATI
jgi:baseplate J-like protein